MESTQQKIRDEQERICSDAKVTIKKMLSIYIKAVRSLTITELEDVASKFFNTAYGLKPKKVHAQRLWNTMTRVEKAKWFIFNKWPLKHDGFKTRLAYEKLNAMGDDRKMPCYFVQHPKQEVLIDFIVVSPHVINNIDIKVTI